MTKPTYAAPRLSARPSRPPPSRKTDRLQISSAPSIDAEVVVDHFKKNRSGDTVKVCLRPWEGQTIFDVRTWHPEGAGRKPGKGFACSLKLLPVVAKAVAKAEAKARELGLLPASDGAKS